MLALFLLAMSFITSGNQLSRGEPIEVLFIGHSFTSFAEETLSTALKISKHNESKFEFHTLGGPYLALFVHKKFEYFKKVNSVINRGDWGFVVLQERSVVVGRNDDYLKRRLHNLVKL